MITGTPQAAGREARRAARGRGGTLVALSKGQGNIPTSAHVIPRDNTSGGDTKVTPGQPGCRRMGKKTRAELLPWAAATWAPGAPMRRRRGRRVGLETAPKAPFQTVAHACHEGLSEWATMTAGNQALSTVKKCVAHVGHRWPTQKCGEWATRKPLIQPAKVQIRHDT